MENMKRALSDNIPIEFRFHSPDFLIFCDEVPASVVLCAQSLDSIVDSIKGNQLSDLPSAGPGAHRRPYQPGGQEALFGRAVLK